MLEIFNKIVSFETKTIDKFKKQNYIERNTYKDFDKINFPIFWIVGLRWIWKTTYLLSRKIKTDKSLYISCDWNFLIWTNLLELILYINNNFWISTFYLDELQFLGNWDSILKNLYDISDIKIIFSGSSKISLKKTSYDLSRRVILKKLDIFSYLEYLNIKHKLNIEWFTFDELLENYQQLSFKYSKYFSKDIWKNDYLRYGEFGYFYSGYENEFNFLLWNSIKKSIYEDLPQIANLDTKNLSKLEKLLFYIANMWASSISINSLSKKIQLDNKIIKLYLEYLEQLGWIYNINKYWNLTDNIRKEIKIYLSSNNLANYFCIEKDSNFVWKQRETFFLQNMARFIDTNNIFYKKRTDFIIKYKQKEYNFEIWWKNKSRNDVFTIKDDILIAEKNMIPLWLFGFVK